MRRTSVHVSAGLGLGLLLLLGAGCRDRQPSSPAVAPEQAPQPLRAPADAPDDARQTFQSPIESKLAAQEPPPLEAMAAARKLIRTGQLALEVADYRTAATKATQLAESRGGYLAETHSMRGARDTLQGSLTLRVPAAQFEAIFGELKQLGKVRSEGVGTQDITKAYTDLETRLRVKKDAEARVRDILRNRTAKLGDVLEAERELTRLTEEIEQMEGERRYYDQQVSLSTITVALSEPQPILESSGLEPIREAIHGAVEVMARSVATLIYAIVFFLPWLLAAWILWKLLRRARRRRARSQAA